MSGTFSPGTPPHGVIAGIDAAVDGLASLDLTGLSDEDCVRLVPRIEVAARRLQAGSLPVLREVTVRRAFSKVGCSSPSALLMSVARLRGRAARARMEAMNALTASVTPSGQIIEPRYSETAAALIEGAIDLDHAATVIKVMAKIGAQGGSGHP